MSIQPPARRIIRALVCLSLAALAGCATSFHEIKVPAPPPGETTTVRAQSVLIRNVTDQRAFQDHPAEPSTPSLADAELDIAPSALKARAIGRVRDGFGKARGNALLPEWQTVEGLVRESLANVFRGLGYQIETDAGLMAGGDMTVDVTIEDFWGWVDVNPGGGFTGSGAMYMSGRMLIHLNIVGPVSRKSSRTIEVTARHRLGVGVTPKNWEKLYKILLDEFAIEARKLLNDLPEP